MSIPQDFRPENSGASWRGQIHERGNEFLRKRTNEQGVESDSTKSTEPKDISFGDHATFIARSYTSMVHSNRHFRCGHLRSTTCSRVRGARHEGHHGPLSSKVWGSPAARKGQVNILIINGLQSRKRLGSCIAIMR